MSSIITANLCGICGLRVSPFNAGEYAGVHKKCLDDAHHDMERSADEWIGKLCHERLCLACEAPTTHIDSCFTRDLWPGRVFIHTRCLDAKNNQPDELTNEINSLAWTGPDPGLDMPCNH